MKIELKRAFAPDEIGQEQECGICEVRFITEVVLAEVLYWDMDPVCPACVSYLGRRNPEKFPTIEEYEEANRRYTEPVYASVEEITELYRVGDPSVHEAYSASWLSRRSPA